MKLFEDYYRGCDEYCSIGRSKALAAYGVIMSGPKGDFAEVGVYRGGFTMFLGRVAADLGVKVYGFDTFTGMPFKDDVDVHQVGDFVHPDGEFSAVKGRVNDTVTLVKGVFHKDIKDHRRRYAFVHLDADQYQSTIDGLEFFYPKLIEGGAILLDDYDWHACPGVKIALKEFGVSYKQISTYQALIKK